MLSISSLSLSSLSRSLSLSLSSILDAARANPTRVLVPTAAVGSVYALFSWLFGGFYRYPWQVPGVVLRVTAVVQLTLLKYVLRGFKPVFPQWTLRFELMRAVINCLKRDFGDCVGTAKNAAFIRHQTELLGYMTGPATDRQNNTVTTSFLFNGLEHLWVRSALSPTTPKHRAVVLYFHGGGYVMMSPRMYNSFASDLQSRIHPLLAQKLGVTQGDVQVDVLLANYRKAPEHPYPIPPQDALKMYEYLLHEEKLSPSQIIVMGDSAGGGLSITTMLRLRDKDPSLLPAAAILSCPYVDREIDGDETKTPYCFLADKAARAMSGVYYKPHNSDPSTWGDASPIHCDLQGLPPAYIQAADLDYIYSQSTRLHAKAIGMGLPWTLEVFPNMPHVFSTMPLSVLPAAAKGLDAFAEYAATQFARSLATKAA